MVQDKRKVRRQCSQDANRHKQCGRKQQQQCQCTQCGACTRRRRQPHMVRRKNGPAGRKGGEEHGRHRKLECNQSLKGGNQKVNCKKRKRPRPCAAKKNAAEALLKKTPRQVPLCMLQRGPLSARFCSLNSWAGWITHCCSCSPSLSARGPSLLLLLLLLQAVVSR
jgi:hypothetical protein